MFTQLRFRIASAALAAVVAATMAAGLGPSVASAHRIDKATPNIIKGTTTAAGSLTTNVK